MFHIEFVILYEKRSAGVRFYTFTGINILSYCNECKARFPLEDADECYYCENIEYAISIYYYVNRVLPIVFVVK